MLTIVIPVYNVFHYLDEGLRSIQQQSWQHFEAILVDDGSSDGSERLVEEWAAKDSRFSVVHKVNAGLGAARNTGAALAKGKYIAFFDSDDVVEPYAYRQAIETLEKTGSDFAVAPYRRLTDGVVSPPATWIRAVHEVERLRVNVAHFPEIQVNVMAWSKVYRRSFFESAVGRYPEGSLYEDQVPASKSYATAAQFDVLTRPAVRWRQRVGSITDRSAEVDNLRAALAADREVVRYLQSCAPDAAMARMVQYMRADTFLLKNLGAGGPEYFDVVRAALVEWWDAVPREALIDQVPLRFRVAYACCLYGTVEQAANFVLAGGLSGLNWVYDDGADGTLYGRLVPRLAQHEADLSGLPAWVFRASRNDVFGTSILDDFRWDGSSIHLSGYAYLGGVPDDDLQIDVALQDLADHRSMPIAITRKPSELASVRTRHPLLDYRQSGFEAWIPAEELVEFFRGSRADKMNLGISVRISGHGEVVIKPQFARTFHLGVAADEVRVLDDTRLVLRRRKGRPVVHLDRQLPRFVDRIAVEGRQVQIALRDAPRVLNRVTIASPRGDMKRVRPSADGWIRLPEVTESRTRATRVLTSLDQISGALAMDESTQWPSGPGQDLWVMPGSRGRPFFFEARESALVEDVDVTSEGLQIDLRVHPEVETPIVELHSQKLTVVGRLETREEPGSWRVAFPLWSIPAADWQPATIPSGRYSLKVSTDADHQLRCHLSRPLELSCPRLGMHVDPEILVDLVRGPRRRFSFVVDATGAAEHRIVSQRYRLTSAYQQHTTALRPAVYLQCLRGDQVNDSQLVMARALNRTHPEVEIVWGVQDNSVSVPVGHSAVVIGSPEYFEAMSSCAVLIFNHEVPDYLRKKPGQVVVQTYHGHPFKMMGLSRFSALGYPPFQVERSLDWRRSWDYLISPGPIATRLYRENYPLDYEVIESGHPRNDDLVGATEQQRLQLREDLGIAPHQTAILYAPTWRDYLARDPWSSEMVQFLDPEALSESLGEDYVLLLRGHPAHGRGRTYRRAEGTGVVDVTYHPNVTELMIASDIGVFDYSSIRFDYAATRRPMIFFVPDEEQFFAAAPGLLPFDDTAPGPKATTLDELLEAIAVVKQNPEAHSDAYEAFVESFLPLDDGHAGERAIAELGRRLAARSDVPWQQPWSFRGNS